MRWADKLIVDIGCGDKPKGTINVDIRVPSNVKEIPNFIQADIRYLPFNDHVFDEVRTSNLFWYEDCAVTPEKHDFYLDAGKILKEIVRVAKRQLNSFRLYYES